MDIHKPKPWNGVREFLKEFGVIVLGVLVALGAEQTAEWAHRQAEVREAREALRAEIADDMMWAQMNQRRQVCGRRYLDRFAAWAAGGSPPPLTSAASRVLELNSASWDVVKTGPVAAMPLRERLAFARFYGLVADYNTMIERERTDGLHLAEPYGLKRLTANDANSLLRAVMTFRSIETVLVGMGDGIAMRGAETGARATPVAPKAAAELDAFCRLAGVN
jgi:hypothetical protein